MKASVDAKTGRQVGAPLQHDYGIADIEFSPDGRRVVTASSDSTARIWETETGRMLVRPLKHERGLSQARFSPDGRFVVTASSDGTARVWDAATGDAVTPLLKVEGFAMNGLFSPDGKWMLVVGGRHFSPGVPGRARLFRFTPSERSVKDLSAFAELLAGVRLDDAGNLVSIPNQALAAAIAAARASGLLGAASATNTVFAWHSNQANAAADQKNPFAEVFHLERMLTLKPEDTGLQTRLASIRERAEWRDSQSYNPQ